MPWVVDQQSAQSGRWVPDVDARPQLPSGGPAVPVEGVQPPPQPELSLGESAMRGFQIGGQAVGRGVADLAGAPVDLTSAALNALSWGAERGINAIPGVDGFQTPRITDPVGGSQSISDLASFAAESAGVPTIEQADMTPQERIAYGAVRTGTSGLAGGAGLARAAGKRAVSATPRVFDSFMRPYEANAAKTVVGDTAAGMGSGAMVAGGHEFLPDEAQGPMTDFVLSLMGGAGGLTLANARNVPGSLADTATGFLPDNNVPMQEIIPPTAFTPALRRPVLNRETERAARAVQSTADNPRNAAREIGEASEAYQNDGLPVPTSGTISKDPGLLAMEQGARASDPLPFQKKDQEVRTAAADRVQSVTPIGAEPRAATEFAAKEAKRIQGEADARVTAAETASAKQLETEQTVAAPYREPPSKGASSTALDEVVVDQTMKPRQAEKNKKFSEIPDAERDAAPLQNAAKAVRETLGQLNDPSQILPQGTLARIESLAATKRDIPGEPQSFKVDQMGVSERTAGRPAETVSEGGTVSFQDMNKLRPELTDGIRAAQRAGNYTLADNLKTLKREIGNEADRMAAEGQPQAAEALKYYKEEFAPFFATGQGGKLRDAVNKDASRTNTPPTSTADRFLFVGAGSKEAARDLRKILEIAPDPAAGKAAARNYVIADLAKTVDKDGTINPRKLKDWVSKRADMLSEMPELDTEVSKLLQDVVNQRAKTNTLAAELKKTVTDAKLTEREIQNGALSLLLDSSPDVAVAKVFAKTGDREKRMADIVRTLGKDKAAAQGWKRAVSDYLIDRISNANVRMTDGDGGPINYAQLGKLFKEHESVLSKVYSSAEMNSLRQAQRLLEPYGELSKRATVGSPTTENNSQAWRVFEALWKVQRGMLRGGGEVRAAKMAAATLPDDTKAVQNLVLSVFFDPEVAQYLLTKPVKEIGTPKWNANLNRAIGLSAAAREDVKGTDTED